MKLRIGTRRSRLALAQAGEVAERLGSLGMEVELVPMTTSGDRGAPASASPAGVKGLFVAEIVRALQRGDVDLAVHSAKDLPAHDDEGVTIAAVPERADAFDVLVTRRGELKDGALVGTSSLRRQAQLLRLRPELRVTGIRGNIETRLAKLDSGDVDGLILAAAGLARLGITPPNATSLSLDEMVPAPGQGVLAVQARADDANTQEAAEPLDHPDSRAALEAERALMARMGGGCALPLGAYAWIDGGGLRLAAVVASPDGRHLVRATAEAESPSALADIAASKLLSAGAGDILAAVRENHP